MDRLSAAHLRALELERECLLEQRHWQRLVNQAKREQHAAVTSPGWTRVFKRIPTVLGCFISKASR